VGVEAIRDFLEDLQGSYEDHVTEGEETVDLGHGVVFSGWRLLICSIAQVW
jgi:hypothetical protein